MDGFNYIVNKFSYKKPFEYYSQSDYETVMFKPEYMLKPEDPGFDFDLDSGFDFEEVLLSVDSDRVVGMFLDDYNNNQF